MRLQEKPLFHQVRHAAEYVELEEKLGGKNLLQELLTFSPFLFSTPLPVILWSQLLQRSVIGYPLALFHWFSLFLANKGMSFLLPAIESAQLLTLVHGTDPI